MENQRRNNIPIKFAERTHGVYILQNVEILLQSSYQRTQCVQVIYAVDKGLYNIAGGPLCPAVSHTVLFAASGAFRCHDRRPVTLLTVHQ
jgi:hypothetical protein